MKFLIEFCFSKKLNFFDVIFISTLVSMKDIGFLETTMWCIIGASISIAGMSILKKMEEKEDERGS